MLYLIALEKYERALCFEINFCLKLEGNVRKNKDEKSYLQGSPTA